MSFRILYILLLIFGYGPTLLADTQPVILNRLASLSGNIQVFCYSHQLPFLIADLPQGFNESGYGIVKSESGLFILPQGTGRVYGYQPGSGSWKRLDSTFFSGYNFGSVQFSYRDHIYSFGGYGLWQTNGVLRDYNFDAGEWHTVKTNLYIPWKLRDVGRANFYYLDTLSGKLIINGLGESGFQTLKDQTDTEIGKDIYTLDILNGEWQRLGRFRDTAYEMIGFLPWGILDLHGVVTDIQRNRYYRLNSKVLSKLQAITYKSLRASDNLISFCYDSTVYMARDAARYDSLTISRADLTDMGIPVYQPVESGFFEKLSGFSSYAFVSLALLAGFFFGNYFRLKRNSIKAIPNSELPIKEPEKKLIHTAPNTQAVAEQPTQTPPDEKVVTFRSSRLLDLLEQKERLLLDFIYRYSAEERLTTIEEINKVIGASSRSAEIQKRMRSDLIGSINQKMGLITKDKKPVIEKQRSEFDKRSFEYYIRTEHMDLVARVLGSK